jgi:hypothetical protein
MRRGGFAALAATGALAGSLAAAAPAQAAKDYGLVMRPYAGYTDDAVEIASTTPCPDNAKARIVVWPTGGAGARGTEVTAPVGADGHWRYRGTFWSRVTDGRYWLVVNCLNSDGDGTMTYEPGWTFYVKDGTYRLDGLAQPPPKAKPVPTTPPPVVTAPPAPSPTRERVTPTPKATTPPPKKKSVSPTQATQAPTPDAEPTATPTPGSVTLVATDSGDGMGGWAAGGAVGAGALGGLGATVLIRRRKPAARAGSRT